MTYRNGQPEAVVRIFEVLQKWISKLKLSMVEITNMGKQQLAIGIANVQRLVEINFLNGLC